MQSNFLTSINSQDKTEDVKNEKLYSAEERKLEANKSIKV